MDALQERIRERKHEILELTGQIDRMREEVKRVEIEIGLKEHEIVDLEGILKLKDSEISELEELIRQKDRFIAQLESQGKRIFVTQGSQQYPEKASYLQPHFERFSVDRGSPQRISDSLYAPGPSDSPRDD